MSASLSRSLPKSVTYVLNLLCYLCSEPAPLSVKPQQASHAENR
jgi:hypothetical protein